MTDVSSRALMFFRMAAAAGAVQLDELYAGLPVQGTRLPWDIWVELCERFAARLGGEEELIAAGRFGLGESVGSHLGRAAALVASPRQLYHLGLRWATPAIYPTVAFSIADERPDILRIGAEILPGFRGCRAWLLILEGGLAYLPNFLGRPNARVERLELGDRRASWRVHLPESPGLSTMLRRLVAALRSPAAVADELAAQQTLLGHTLAEMRRSAAAFRNALDALPDLLAVHAAGEILYVNPALARFVGEDPARLRSAPLERLVRADDRPTLAALLAAPCPAGPTQLRLQRGDGGEGWVEARSVGDLEFGGLAARIFVATDVTAERATRADLERSQATVRALLTALPDLVLRVDRATTVCDVQGGTELAETQFFAGLIGRRFSELLPALQGPSRDAFAAAADALTHAMATGDASDIELAVPIAGGRVRELTMRIFPHPGGDEAVAVIRDETARRDVARRLEQAERLAALGTLAAGIAHEINNPLTFVSGNLTLLRKVLGGEVPAAPGEVKALLDDMEEGCRRIRDTVEQMHDLSRAKPRPTAPVDLARVVERSLRIADNALRHRARVVTELSHVPPLRGDATELGQVVLNLLLNAAQALPEDAEGEVTVRLFPTRDAAVLEVVDSGRGIAPEHLPRIFDPFFTTKAHENGTGLGLAIVHRVVQAYGGAIEVESDPGRGTTVRVRLPLIAAEEPESGDPPTTHAPEGAARVLIVDDDARVARTLQRLLTGHDVEIATDGELAYRRLRDGPPPQLVLCDLMMPGLSGIDLYERLANERPRLLERFVFITGGAFTARAERFLAERGVRVLRKPFDAARLRELAAEAAQAAGASS